MQLPEEKGGGEDLPASPPLPAAQEPRRQAGSSAEGEARRLALLLRSSCSRPSHDLSMASPPSEKAPETRAGHLPAGTVSPRLGQPGFTSGKPREGGSAGAGQLASQPTAGSHSLSLVSSWERLSLKRRAAQALPVASRGEV